MTSVCRAQLHHGGSPSPLSCLLRRTYSAISLRRCCLCHWAALTDHKSKRGRLHPTWAAPLASLCNRFDLRFTQERSRSNEGGNCFPLGHSESANDLPISLEDSGGNVAGGGGSKYEAKAISNVHVLILSPNLSIVNGFGDNSRKKSGEVSQ